MPRIFSCHYKFQFDRVLHPECTQEDVFTEISQLIQSSIDGYNMHAYLVSYF